MESEKAKVIEIESKMVVTGEWGRRNGTDVV